jgi:hypothetical protein
VSTVEFDAGESPGNNTKLETADAAKAAKNEASAPETSVRPAAVPAQQRGAIYTMMAHQAVNAAELLNRGLAKKTLGKTSPRRVEVAEPDGPSTSGGKRARQSITLVPISGDGGALMCGWIDVSQKLGEMRPYSEVVEQCKMRFGTKFEATSREYDELVKDLAGMLKTLGFQLVQEVDEADDADEPAAASNTMRFVAAAVAAVAVGVAIMLLK